MTHRSSQRTALIRHITGVAAKIVAARVALLLLVLVLITNGGAG